VARVWCVWFFLVVLFGSHVEYTEMPGFIVWRAGRSLSLFIGPIEDFAPRVKIRFSLLACTDGRVEGVRL